MSSPAMTVIWKYNIYLKQYKNKYLPYLIVPLNPVNQPPYLYIKSVISALHINVSYLIYPFGRTTTMMVQWTMFIQFYNKADEEET